MGTALHLYWAVSVQLKLLITWRNLLRALESGLRLGACNELRLQLLSMQEMQWTSIIPGHLPTQDDRSMAEHG